MRTINRYVTDVSDGRSCLHPLLSGPAPRKEEGVVEIWAVDALPATLDSDSDPAGGPYEHDPVPGGIRFRCVEIEPSLDNVAVELVDSPTLDFVFVVEGEITLVLASEEVIMLPGDCAILRGHPHRWVNRTDRPTLLAGALVDARGV